MKRTIMSIALLIALMVAFGTRAQPESTTNTGSHLGTWQLASYKYGEAKEGFTDYPEGQRRIKLITDTHFTWVEFDVATKRAEGMAGGACSLVGDTYTESIDFADLGMAPYLGAKHTFTIRVEGDKFFLSGSLADGLAIEEVWERVKASGK
jgi:hypothetical protein